MKYNMITRTLMLMGISLFSVTAAAEEASDLNAVTQSMQEAIDQMSDEEIKAFDAFLHLNMEARGITDETAAEGVTEEKESSEITGDADVEGPTIEEVEQIAMHSDKSALTYTGYEFAPEDFYKNLYQDYDPYKTILINFDFENMELAQKTAGETYQILVYQNGAEAENIYYYDTEGVATAHNLYGKSVIKGGTVPVAATFVLEDYSPITVYVTEWDTEATQIMTLELEEPEVTEVFQPERSVLYGEWIGVDNDKVIELTSDSCLMRVAGSKNSSIYGNWELKRNCISYGTRMNFIFSEVDGVLHMNVDMDDDYAGEYILASGMQCDTYAMGDTITNDRMEVVVEEFSINHKLDTSTYLPVDSGSGLVPSGDGVGYGTIRFRVKNLSQNPIDWKDVVNYTIDYNNGYEFGITSSDYAFLAKPNGTQKIQFTPNTSFGNPIQISPLTEEEFVLSIACLEAIKDDSENPLKLKLELQSTAGNTDRVEIDVRTQKQIYTDSDTVKKVQEALNNAGYNCGTPDGAAGNGTYAALNNYQQANGLTVENAITDEVLGSLGLK